MKGTIRLSEPVDCEKRTIVPLIRDITMISAHCGLTVRDPVGLVIMENNQAWFVSLADEVTLSVIDEIVDVDQ